MSATWLKFWTELCEALWHDSKKGTNVYEPPWVVSNIMKKYKITENKPHEKSKVNIKGSTQLPSQDEGKFY